MEATRANRCRVPCTFDSIETLVRLLVHVWDSTARVGLSNCGSHRNPTPHSSTSPSTTRYADPRSSSYIQPAPKTEEDMMKEVFLYTDRVVSMIRPRKLLMIAIDGVAPRAKMNQQRSRRFRTAQESKVKEEERIAAIAEWEGESRSSAWESWK